MRIFYSYINLKILFPQNKYKKENKDKERYERRILDELSKMFSDSNSFYFSFDYDLTSSLELQNNQNYNPLLPLWQRAHENFFWNKYMIKLLMNEQLPATDAWVVPIIQGFVQIEFIPLSGESIKSSNTDIHQQVSFIYSHFF